MGQLSHYQGNLSYHIIKERTLEAGTALHWPIMGLLLHRAGWKSVMAHTG